MPVFLLLLGIKVLYHFLVMAATFCQARSPKGCHPYSLSHGELPEYAFVYD